MSSLTSLELTIFCVTAVLLGDVVWIVTDRRPPTERRRSRPSLSYPRLLLVLGPQVISGLIWPWPQNPADTIIVPMGMLLFVMGLGLAIWAKLFMGDRWNQPALLEERQDCLIVDGPFALSRNPIYLGVFLMALGFSLALRSYFVVLVIPLFLSLRASAVAEERILEERFGRVFTGYTHRVPRFLGRAR